MEKGLKRFFGAKQTVPKPVYDSPFKDYAGPSDEYIDDPFPELVAPRKALESVGDADDDDDEEILDTTRRKNSEGIEEDEGIEANNFSKLRLRLYEDDFESLRSTISVEDSDEDVIDYSRSTSVNRRTGNGVYTIENGISNNPDPVVSDYQHHSINGDSKNGVIRVFNRITSIFFECVRSVQDQVETSFDSARNTRNHRSLLTNTQSDPNSINSIV